MKHGIKHIPLFISGSTAGFLLFLFGHAIGSDSDSKMGPRLRLRMDREVRFRNGSFARLTGTSGSDGWADVFVKTDNPEALVHDGIMVRSSQGGISTAFVPYEKIRSLAQNPSIQWMEEASGCGPALDRSMTDIGVPSLWNGSLGHSYRGAGVIVGFVDYGIDWQHEDFLDSFGRTRIVFLWDQTDSRGVPPDGFGYGSEYTQDQIDQAILSGDGSAVGGMDSIGHGTHVAGIAVGNGRASGNGKPSGVYGGAAPEADLIVVKGSGSGLIPDTRVIDGLNYIFSKAGSLGKPVVANLSVGTQSGPHDGTSLYEQALNALLDTTGRVVVVAAGNDGSNPIHFAEEFSEGSQDTLSVPFFVGEGTPGSEDAVSFDIWYPTYSALSLWVRTPSGVFYGPIHGVSQNHWSTDEGDISAAIALYNGNLEMALRISDSWTGESLIDGLASGTWRLLFQGEPGRFDGWLYESSLPAWLSGRIDFSTTVVEPGNARLAITVGSYITRDEWPSLYADPWGPGSLQVGDRSGISSIGPTRVGRPKPEISAPGEYVVSSLSGSLASTPDPMWIASDSVHWAMRGTSMAAPHVSGVAALLFEKNPDLGSSDIKNSLIQTARIDAWTGPCWNAEWGYGKMDALGAMVETSVVPDKPVSPLPTEVHLVNFPNPFNRNTVIEFMVSDPYPDQDVMLEIRSVTGRRVWSKTSRFSGPGMGRTLWPGIDSEGKTVPAGIYILRLCSGSHKAVAKLVFCP